MVYNNNNNNNNRMVNFLREIYIELDDNGLIVFISENCTNLLGYHMQDLKNKNISNILSFIPQNSISVANIKSSIIAKNGTVIPVDLAGSPIVNYNNDITGYRLSLINISCALNFNNPEKVITQMFERSRDIIYRVELIPTFRFTYLSHSIQEVLGYSAKENLIDPMLVFNLVHPDDRDFLIRKINNDIDYSKPITSRFKHKDGHYVWLEDYSTPIYDENDVLVALEGFNRDITDKKQLEEKLERLSYFDGLTGAYNRYYLDKEIYILNTEKDIPIGIIFCDLDNLKITNDTIGHEFGDKLIVNSFNILKDTFTGDSIIARTGGDEFIVIIKYTSLSIVKKLFLSLCESLEQQNKYNSELKLKISIGYSFSETSIGVTRQIINIADKNMYKDKRSKKI
jgi:diguanylate cyclase (GGDEF)-like protein/PAS domain S-box-containing protein